MATLTREDAARRFAELPLPTTADEHWRFTDLRGFAPGEIVLNGHDRGQTPPMLDLDVAGRAHVTESGIEILSAPDGITFEPLPADYPASIVPDDDKFAVENLARWTHGLLVHVPKGVELDKPLYVQVTSNGGSLYWRMVVKAEEGARFTLIEDLSSAADDVVAYTNAVVELFVEPRAKIEYVSLQNLSKETWHFGRHKALLERDSELDWVLGGFGSKRGKVWIENDLVGEGATSRVTGAYFADGDQHLDYDTFQEHAAPNTESDFAFKGALRERATAVWRGMIRVEENAQKTNAYQENRNLLLSDQAHADSIPGLEIMANDVRCTHGATLGKVNREELFYLMARGLSRAEAERLIVRGFFQDVLDRIELEPVREALGAALEARIPQA
ncbi:MAG TPA: Fe-S cluster assembly protein SufD [Gaiellaceae bacterium]|jgi:Fe-S cluster assembly protein SufD|nr:Fe-S cluster assembly protein SufD [Gaiellaceae bacterium]